MIKFNEITQIARRVMGMSDRGQTFCIYCQKQYANPRNLRKHIEKKHPGTYADQYVNLEYACDKG